MRAALLLALALVLVLAREAQARSRLASPGGAVLIAEAGDDAGPIASPGGPAAALAAAAGAVLSAGEAVLETFGAAVTRAFQLPERAAPYAEAIGAAEVKFSLPTGLLGRVLYQESRFRPDVIEGRTVSSAGAVGIAQIVPRWHPGVDPRDPFASIEYAAGYLRKLFDRFGSWADALAAYNWGPGNLARLGLGAAPSETRDYVREIAADVEGIA